MIPEDIKKDHILLAMKEIDEKKVPPTRKSTKYQLSYNGNLYPPKYVISLAYKFLRGTELPPWEFSGGMESNTFLTKRGFEIISLTGSDTSGKKALKKPAVPIKKTPKKPPASIKQTLKFRHTERCSDCKNTIIDMFRVIYGTVKIEHKMNIEAKIHAYSKESYYSDLKDIYYVLQTYRGNKDFVKSNFLQPCDLFVPDPGFVVEMDESQHFSLPRALALEKYPDNLSLGYEVDKWISYCKQVNSKDGNPIYRDEQRAWYDTLRDFLPLIQGLQPTIRIAMKDYNWCSLNPTKSEDVEKFKSILQLERKDEKKIPLEEKIQLNSIHIATVCLQSTGRYDNYSREKLLLKIIKETPPDVDVLLLPAGFYYTDRKPLGLYNEIQSFVSRALKSESRDMTICLGIDGRRGADQMALAITKNGIEALGRKFFPTESEKSYLKGADSFLALEDGYARNFQVKNRNFYLAVCYDSFGLKNPKLTNPNVDAILNLVHQFYPKGQGNSGDVFFARHGFAGASQNWGCPVFGATVFFNREIANNWPTGVIWDTTKKHTRNWKYEDNTMKPKRVLAIGSGEKADEKAMIRVFEL